MFVYPLDDIAERYYNCGTNFADGTGVERDEERAYASFLEAAKKGHAKAQYEVAGRLSIGNGVEKDISAAKEWWRKTATLTPLRISAIFSRRAWAARNRTQPKPRCFTERRFKWG